MEKINLKTNNFLYFDKTNGDLYSFSELGSLVEFCKPQDSKLDALKRLLDDDYKNFGNRNLEVNGPNDGPFINEYHKLAGTVPGDPWCCSYVFGSLYKVGVKIIKTGYVPAMETWAKSNGIYSINPAPYDIMMLYDKDGPYHTGFVLSVEGDNITTQEGNTNTAGSPEGIGIFKRTRSISNCAFVKWQNIK